jgi:ethanolamine utilization protein EutN
VPFARYLIARPLSLPALRGQANERGEDLVVFDALGAGAGSRIGVSEGREAANPFLPHKAPVDAYCACLIDEITLS